MLCPKLAAANGFNHFVLILQLDLKPVKQARAFAGKKKMLSEGRRKKIPGFYLALGFFSFFFSELLLEGW